MISGHDLYTVMSAVVPLYVAMILAYGSVRWWKILTPDQCGGINRFVAIFAVPLLSFQILAGNDPYKMNTQFIAADALQKLAILCVLAIWARYSSSGSMEWMITLFMLATLPNTLVMGIPLLAAMYGSESGSLVVQAVVLQCIIWYTLLLFLYEYRSARKLIRDQFPKTAASIVSFKVESDVVSLDGARDPIQADAEIGDDGKIHVTVRKSTSSVSMFSPCRGSVASSKARPSNLTGADIYSIHSSRNLTPRDSSFNHSDYYSMMMMPAFTNPPPPPPPPLHHHPPHARTSNFTASDVYSLHSSRGPTPRTSNFNNDDMAMAAPPPSRHFFPPLPAAAAAAAAARGGGGSSELHGNNNRSNNNIINSSSKQNNNNKELVHMFVWSSSGSPISEGNVQMLNDDFAGNNKDVRLLVTANDDASGAPEYERDDFSFGHGGGGDAEPNNNNDNNKEPNLSKMGSTELLSNNNNNNRSSSNNNNSSSSNGEGSEMPAVSVMTKLILDMVWRKLLRNPNTYSSLLGLTWALVSFKWHVKMPDIVENSILILSKAGLGMAMFSLGLFMALQKRMLVCGTSLALFAMVVRFITGPAVMAATSIAVGLRGVNLHVSIVQAALPQGIVPFVFAKEYNVHPDVLSTAVIFGMLVAFPITMLYYVLLGL